jgi:hypothetical protein
VSSVLPVLTELLRRSRNRGVDDVSIVGCVWIGSEAAGDRGSFSFIKEAGEWRIWQDASPEEDLAVRLVAATRNEDRESLLAEDNELLALLCDG